MQKNDELIDSYLDTLSSMLYGEYPEAAREVWRNKLARFSTDTLISVFDKLIASSKSLPTAFEAQSMAFNREPRDKPEKIQRSTADKIIKGNLMQAAFKVMEKYRSSALGVCDHEKASAYASQYADEMKKAFYSHKNYKGFNWQKHYQERYDILTGNVK